MRRDARQLGGGVRVAVGRQAVIVRREGMISINGAGWQGWQRFVQQHGAALMMIVVMFFSPVRTILGRFFPSSLHQRLVTFHTKDALRGPGILEVFDLLFAVPTSKAGGAERLIAGEDGKILDLVPTCTAAIGTVVADQGAVAEEEQVGVGVEEGQARVAAEAVNMPSIAGW